jgi:recombinational DNA repair protein (RecF pathway)
VKHCAICGTNLSADLFSAVTGEPCCSICKVRFIGGLPTTPERIATARAGLGLADGDFLAQDNGAEARRILRKGDRR